MKAVDPNRIESIIQELGPANVMVKGLEPENFTEAVVRLENLTYDLETLSLYGGPSDQIEAVLPKSEELYGHILDQARNPKYAEKMVDYLYKGARRLGEVNARLGLMRGKEATA